MDELDDDSIEGEGGTGRSIPSNSASSITTLSSSIEGKKLRNNNSACHLDAFLNSTQTSMRPGRESAGSSRSRWFVVLLGYRENQRGGREIIFLGVSMVGHTRARQVTHKLTRTKSSLRWLRHHRGHSTGHSNSTCSPRTIAQYSCAVCY